MSTSPSTEWKLRRCCDRMTAALEAHALGVRDGRALVGARSPIVMPMPQQAGVGSVTSMVYGSDGLEIAYCPFCAKKLVFEPAATRA